MVAGGGRGGCMPNLYAEMRNRHADMLAYLHVDSACWYGAVYRQSGRLARWRDESVCLHAVMPNLYAEMQNRHAGMLAYWNADSACGYCEVCRQSGMPACWHDGSAHWHICMPNLYAEMRNRHADMLADLHVDQPASFPASLGSSALLHSPSTGAPFPASLGSRPLRYSIPSNSVLPPSSCGMKKPYTRVPSSRRHPPHPALRSAVRVWYHYAIRDIGRWIATYIHTLHYMT